MKKIIVIYHKDCLDGFGAAWAAWRKFGNKAEYIGIYPGSNPLKTLKIKELYFVDIGYDKKQMLNLLKTNKRIVFIDHHVSRGDIAKLLPEKVFDISHSGSFLSWQYFHPRKAIPRLLRYIEDYDLWKFRLQDTRELSASLETYNFDFTQWNKIASDFENNKKRERYVEEGKAIIKYIDKVVKQIIENNTDEVIFRGHKALAVNSSVLASEIGNFIVRKRKFPLGIIWSYNHGRIYYQLRSHKHVDVSKIAKEFGGGGHKEAAGFRLKSEIKFPWKKKRKGLVEKFKLKA